MDIQRNYRGLQSRQRVREVKKSHQSAVKIQIHVRRKISKGRVDRRKHEWKAATRIQAVHRSRSARKLHSEVLQAHHE